MLRISEFKKKTGVHVTTNHNAKMAGVSSISTSPTCNPYCPVRAGLQNSICAHCYSMSMNKRYKGLRETLERNAETLYNRILQPDEMPRLFSETGYFRFEAFGDLATEVQVVNYFNIAAANPHMMCALWTKNPWIIAAAMKKYGVKKPENLTIIGGSYYVNEPMNYSGFPFIDKVFTVYDKAHAENVEINCGGRSCADCGRCYENKGGRVVSELLK